LLLSTAGPSLWAQQYACFNERASLNPVEQGANSASNRPDISADGRYVVFESTATNLDAWDTQPQADIFIRDLQLGDTYRISTPSPTGGSNGDSRRPSISSDGNFVVFESSATNLVSGDSNGQTDLFLWSRATGQLSRVSVASNGSQGNGESVNARISANGQFVVFESRASNLDPADTNSTRDIFVRNLQQNTTRCVSRTHLGASSDRDSANGSISADGTRVAFESDGTNLVFWDTNNHTDIFVRNLVNDTILRASLAWNAAEGNGPSTRPSISPDGLQVAFESNAMNLVVGDNNYQTDIFLRELSSGYTRRISTSVNGIEGQMRSFEPQFAADGRFVAFLSEASNLVANDTNNFTDVFVRDVLFDQVFRVSRGHQMSETQNHSRAPRISATGRWVVFENDANNLVESDQNGCSDVFRVDWIADPGQDTTAYCQGKLNSLGCQPAITWSGTPSLSAGSGFQISGQNFLNNKSGIFIYSLNGPDSRPFFGGTLCLKPGLVRGPLVNSGGNVGVNDCSGVLNIDFNQYLAGGYGPQPPPSVLVPGKVVHCQWYGRDNGFPIPNNISLSNALRFVVQP
jgi:Tol biopolymer transport system component